MQTKWVLGLRLVEVRAWWRMLCRGVCSLLRFFFCQVFSCGDVASWKQGFYRLWSLFLIRRFVRPRTFFFFFVTCFLGLFFWFLSRRQPGLGQGARLLSTGRRSWKWTAMKMRTRTWGEYCNGWCFRTLLHMNSSDCANAASQDDPVFCSWESVIYSSV